MENDKYIKGIFVRELKNRFLCEVLIDNRYEQCYLPCSSKISEFIDLTNKIVLLKRNKGTKTKTSFSLFAVYENNENLILLDLNYLNILVKEQLYNVNSKREIYMTPTFRSDIYLENENKVVEVKGIISDKDRVEFPSIKAKRAEKQLIEIKKILLEGIKVEYVIVLTNKEIGEINFNPKREKFMQFFKECIDLGMKLKVYSLKFKDNKFYLVNNSELQKFYK